MPTFLLSILLIGSAMSTALPETTTQLDVQFPEFENHKVVPDVVDVAPLNLVSVTYGSGVSVDLGNVLTPIQVKDVPTTVTYEADSSKFYTLIMTDADVPTMDPMHREGKHWLVANIPGNSVDEGDTLAAYVGSGPPQGAGLHRYIFLVFEQPKMLNFTAEPRTTRNSFEHRGGFSTRNFAKKYNLGNPVAGNLYLAEWDDYVPKLYEQIFGKSMMEHGSKTE